MRDQSCTNFGTNRVLASVDWFDQYLNRVFQKIFVCRKFTSFLFFELSELFTGFIKESIVYSVVFMNNIVKDMDKDTSYTL